MGEFDLIARYFAEPAARLIEGLALTVRPPLGIGDDCAVLPSCAPGHRMVVSTDTLVNTVHFFADVDPSRLGHKALAVNLSDLAAMGASPIGFTLALTLPRIDEQWLEAFSKGLLSLAQAHACPLIGGDTTRGPLSLTITVFGQVQQDLALLRSRACDGDDIWVSGRLGGAAAAVNAIYAGEKLASDHPQRLLLELPTPRLALGQALLSEGLSECAMDLSDGLVSDLSRLLTASGIKGALIDLKAIRFGPGLEALPVEQAARYALAGGDDYELIFLAKPNKRQAILSLGDALGLELDCVGRVDRMLNEIQVIDLQGNRQSCAELVGQGYDHFA